MWYTSHGDDGETGLFGAGRVSKDSPRIEALGDLDEATSSIGFARALAMRADSKPLLLRVQRELSLLMAEVAAPEPERLDERIGAAHVAALEAAIATLGETIEQTHAFTMAGDALGGAALDVARAVVRRAERRVVRLQRDGAVGNPQLVRYLNRLSALLYLLARADDRAAGVLPTVT